MKKTNFQIIALLVTIAIFCSPLPTENTSGLNSIRLSLEKVERDSAVYSGKPIHTIVETADSTYFSDFAWHTGMGKLIIPEGMVNRYAKRFEVDLYWKNYPSRKDIQSNSYFDTVFITIGGRLKESNKVSVRVTNLPVIIDSILIGDSVFNGVENFLRYQIRSKNADIPLQFYARDLDGKMPDLTFSGNTGRIQLSNTNNLLMTYTLPSGYFNDTIHFLIFDHQGSSEYRDINLKRYAANLPPVVDSIVFEDTTLKGANLYQVGFPSFDTLRIKAYAHDPEGTDISCTWKAYVSNRIRNDVLLSNQISYVCTTGLCKNVHTDTTILIDTLKLVVRDNHNDSTVVKIELVKGAINYPPVINAIYIEDSIFTNTDSIIRFPIEYSSKYNIRVIKADPESDTLNVKWTGVPLSQLSQISDTSAVFSSTEAQITDTLVISVSDKKTVVEGKVVLISPVDR